MAGCDGIVYDSHNPAVVTAAPDSGKAVVLTFDDGPGKYLTEILDILKQEDVPAMFFWQSRLLYPDRPWKRVLEEGHLIGSHSVRHPDMTRLSYSEQLAELQRSSDRLTEVTGIRPVYFRPPFGQFNDSTLHAAASLELRTVMWRIASLDWELKNRPDDIIKNVTENLEDGAIILLHELAQTVQALPGLIREIKRKGYRFVLLPSPPS
ncbi:polysaccharide deacetylase family protein [Indiicoccus explosivorum]|uniref:polysaccharide deacetylase family protein n=1 Tax=Indiicoccus explosivorum TaxID=1917864 RepID=UPI001F4D7675|nr:polysaccharide deacetylase family protein [Indiicoccus explosivorum]